MGRGEIIPVHLIRRGPVTSDSGGPIRVIHDILSAYKKTGAYARYGYVSVNEIRLYERGQEHNEVVSDTLLKHAAGITLNASNPGLYLQLRRDARRLRARLKRIPTPGRIVHSHDQIASGLALVSNTTANVLSIHSKGSVLNDVKLKVHPHIAGTWMQRIFESIEREGVRSAGVITFPSAGARDLFDADVPGALDGKDVRTIHNGVDMEAFHHPVPMRAPGEAFTLVSVCAFVPEKRFDRTLDIVEALHREGRDVRLIHIGDGALQGAMHRQVTQRALQHIVVLKGRLDHASVLEEQAKAHAFLLPAERTVFDIASLEAMAAGVPVILSGEGGNREMVATGRNGFLCDPGDTGAFVRSIAAFIDDEELRLNTGQAARRTVSQRFTLERMTAEFDALYEQLLESKR